MEPVVFRIGSVADFNVNPRQCAGFILAANPLLEIDIGTESTGVHAVISTLS